MMVRFIAIPFLFAIQFQHCLADGFGLVGTRLVGFCRYALTVLVEDDVGGELVYAQVLLDGLLLGGRQIVVDEMLACELVFCDCAAPCFCLAAVAKEEICDRQVA